MGRCGVSFSKNQKAVALAIVEGWLFPTPKGRKVVPLKRA
jgi:hypothetical protein